ncbi:TetR/AcrR family transcriptional regulator [Cytobacillus praedii]|uniref:TetR family transcriptional regulator n=1 Tax=Cytobacillus solani TaxID=1637975 RepID=A0A0Q3QLT6_9BACI|nr:MULTISPECIES: TetR/AcrR family transcriptional regulator [Cytobacillus]KOP81661.1 TetR family transcriptional regulator [Bacillus sp. FJAT-21945]KQL18600.1 TetR family transcriptional regulator [Cytobacillus solani]MED3572466.1 TetR/AcrR family transcriptional regulator [Cytobacillus praedii]USK56508.1 TetR/AcrR family transcriptional regulator [Cytobacillus solani]
MAIDRKQLIIEAATKSFSLFGFKATTMDQVAKIANVGKGTIYTFFKNKEELFDEIISSLISEMKRAADEAMDSTLSFHEKVHRGLYQILEFRLKHQLTIKLFQEEKEMGTPAVMEVMIKLEDAILGYLKEKIVAAIDKGEIQECNPEVTAFIMLKLYVALIFDWEKRNEPLEKEEIAKLFEQYIFKGLSNR